MKILVLGATGMLGHKMFQTLRTRFSNTSGTIHGALHEDRLANISLLQNGNVMAFVDAENFPALAATLRRCEPDVIVNCIGVIKQRTEAKAAVPSIKINALLPHRLAEVCSEWGGRLIHFSTDCVFSGERGNYTEEDIKNGAKGLAGLNIGEDEAVYRRILENDDTITYFGKTGKFKADEMIDIIFEQKAIPYLITRKILQWFIYDNPSPELITYYGDYFRKVDFEIKPLLTKIFTEEFPKNNAGSKIKDPLVYILQLMNELNVEQLTPKLLAFYLKQQGMDLFNQTNVKGWNGGKEWLSSQVYLQRNNSADLLCNGRNISRRAKFADDDMMNENANQLLKVSLNWNKSGTNKTIIAELQDRLLFQSDESLQKDWETILKYDFNPKAEGADNAVMRLFNNMVKTPEFQII